MSRFNFIVPLVNNPFDGTPNLFAAITNDSRSLITTLGYINDLAYPLTITTPDFVSPVIPLLKSNDILYITTSANGASEFGSYVVNQVSNSYQLVLNPSGGGVQPFSLALSSIAGLTTAANEMIYTIAPNVYTTSPITTLALDLLADSTQAQMKTTLGIITLDPSDPTKTFIASVVSPVVVGQFASFADVNGTIQSSGIAITDVLLRANNLSDLMNIATARLNLGLGTAAVQNISFFLQSANNLSDLTNVTVAQTNLGLGTAALQNVGFFLQVANNLSDLTNIVLARNNLGLGTAAIKAASNNAQPTLVSVILPTVINNLAVFSDTNGTISDSGSPISGFQPESAALTSIAGLTTSANLMLYTTASNTYATSAITAFSRIMLANPNSATWISTLGLGTAALQNVGFFLQVANNLSDLNSVVTARTNLGLGSAALLAASDPTKPTLASVVTPTTINNVAVFSDINGTIKDSGSTLTGFQPLSAALTSIAGLTTTANQILYTTGSNIYAVTSITPYSISLLANGSASTWQSALGLGSAATQNSNFFLQVANNLSDVANVATSRSNLGLGTAALKSASNITDTYVASVTGSPVVNNVAVFSDTFGTISDSGSPISGFQPLNAALTSISGLTTTANEMIYTTASNTYAVTSLTAFSRSLLANSTTTGWQSTLGLGSAATQNSNFFLQVANNLSDVASAATSRTNLGLGSAALKTASNATDTNVASVNGTPTTGHIAIFNDTAGTITDGGVLGTAASENISFFLQTANNLSDVPNDATARTNLGLGTAATQNSTVFLQVLNNLSDLNNVATARTNLGLGTAALQNNSFFLQSANNLSDVASAATSRTNLGLGTAATKAASNNSDATVASVGGTITSGHVAVFNDTVGTVSDGGLLGTAAFKTASSNAQTGVASTSGTYIINNIVVSADTAGTTKDGGTAISGLVPTTRTITTVGLITGGGALSANITLTVTAAIETDQEAATSNAVCVTPGVQIYHPSAVKARGTLNEAATPTWLDQYNFTTITRNSAGSYTVTMGITFTSANYQVICTPQDGSEVVWAVDQKTTTSFRIRQWTLLGIVLTDVQMAIMVTGTL